MAPQVAAALAVAYFAYHAIEGERGVLAYLKLDSELESAQQIAEQVGQDRAVLEHRVDLLSPDSLDPDLLEEQARTLLNYGHEDEKVIYLERGGEAN
ncbi:MAG: septum formation initiator family protein [Rhodovibrionaceae bacterium]